MPLQDEIITQSYFAAYHECIDWKLSSQEILKEQHISLQKIQIILHKRCSQSYSTNFRMYSYIQQSLKKKNRVSKIWFNSTIDLGHHKTILKAIPKTNKLGGKKK